MDDKDLLLKTENVHVQREVVRAFQISQNQQKKLMGIIRSAIQDIHKMRNSQGQPIRWCYVPILPVNQSATGTCLAMDFGCSDHFMRLALCSVTVHRGVASKDRIRLLDSRAFLLTRSIRHAEMSQFCEFVALCVKRILVDNGIVCTGNCATVYMGVAAGFDVRVKPQSQPASATVQFASKDFRMIGFLGKDFVPQFNDAFKKIDLKVEVVAVINDTVGILLSGIHQIQTDSTVNCSIGVLCHRGGSNLAYLETDQDFLDLCSSDGKALLRKPFGSGYCVIVNAEAGYYIGEKGELECLESFIDSRVIKELNAAFRLECIISGAWYPKLLEHCVKILLGTNAIIGQPADRDHWHLDLSKGFEIFTRCDDWYYKKKQGTNELTSSLKELLGFTHLSEIDAIVLAKICRAIVERTARVTAISVMGIAECIYGTLFPPLMAVAYGGSLFSTLPQLKDMLLQELNRLKPAEVEISLINSNASMGCAITAMCAGWTLHRRGIHGRTSR